jgi:hypothetical protein
VLQFTDGQTAKISALVPGAAEGTFTLNGNADRKLCRRTGDPHQEVGVHDEHGDQSRRDHQGSRRYSGLVIVSGA